MYSFLKNFVKKGIVEIVENPSYQKKINQKKIFSSLFINYHTKQTQVPTIKDLYFFLHQK